MAKRHPFQRRPAEFPVGTSLEVATSSDFATGWQRPQDERLGARDVAQLQEDRQNSDTK